MPSGRKKIEVRVGGRYRTDSGEEMIVIREMNDDDFPFIAVDTKKRLHKYTAKGRYTKAFGNHPMHFNSEIV